MTSYRELKQAHDQYLAYTGSGWVYKVGVKDIDAALASHPIANQADIEGAIYLAMERVIELKLLNQNLRDTVG